MKFAFLLLLMASLSTSTNLAGSQLEDLHWNHRVVIAKVDSDQQLMKFETKLQKVIADLKDYRLVVISLYEDTLKAYGSNHLITADPTLKGDLITNLADKDVALIGLDGGIKAHYAWESFTWKDVFARIDSMPMGQAELRERSN